MRRSMILSSDTAYECPGQLPIFAKTPSFHLGNTGELLRRALPQMGGQPMLVVPCLSLAIWAKDGLAGIRMWRVR